MTRLEIRYGQDGGGEQVVLVDENGQELEVPHVHSVNVEITNSRFPVTTLKFRLPVHHVYPEAKPEGEQVLD